jgi:hypothetical protein
VAELDFWIGEWDVRWDGGSGTNSVRSELGGLVVMESFESADLRGLSLSVKDRDTWRQIWVDSNGAYLAFHGGPNGDEFEFRCNRDNKHFRMRFTEITASSIVWLWERQIKGLWTLEWRIDYARSADKPESSTNVEAASPK